MAKQSKAKQSKAKNVGLFSFVKGIFAIIFGLKFPRKEFWINNWFDYQKTFQELRKHYYHNKNTPFYHLSIKSIICKAAGFTLVELSIVLVVIGLSAGAVMVGKDLIQAAEIRSQVSQIQEYNAAVHTFQTKYNALPGDMPDPTASAFGFTAARGQYRGQGDGNGILEGNWNNSAGGVTKSTSKAGESVVFWVDLSQANLIKEQFSTATENNSPAGNVTESTTPNLKQFLPIAKAGGGYIYIANVNSINYYAISRVTILGWGMQSFPALGVQQAYNIDQKMDDGLPQSGIVQSLYYTNAGASGLWWAGTIDNGGVPYTTATPASSTTCFDNGNVAGATQQYSVAANGSSGNCALFFKFQ